MKTLLQILFWVTRATFKSPQELVLENLALRQQMAVFKASVKRPHLRNRDRFFWVLLSRFWKDWDKSLIIVKPETVVGWYRKGFKLFWTYKLAESFSCIKRGPFEADFICLL